MREWTEAQISKCTQLIELSNYKVHADFYKINKYDGAATENKVMTHPQFFLICKKSCHNTNLLFMCQIILENKSKNCKITTMTN